MDPQLDELTQLCKRQYLETLGVALCGQARADGSLLGFLYADVDRMRAINDILGMPAGDRLLVKIAQVIKSHLHDGAAVGRIGGDEFLVIAPVKSEEELTALAEAIRAEAKTVVVMGGSFDEVSSDQVTLTLGLSCLPRHGSDLKPLLWAADGATGRGKRAGRDRTIWAETP